MSLTQVRAPMTGHAPQRLVHADEARRSLIRPADADLAAVVRQWVELSALARRSLPPAEDATSPAGAALLDFVFARLRDRAEMAVRSHDTLDHRFVTWEIEWIERAWHQSRTCPTGRAEIDHYLARAAYRYRRHPDFDVSWRRSGASAQPVTPNRSTRIASGLNPASTRRSSANPAKRAEPQT